MGKSSKGKGGPVSRKDARKVMKQNEKLKKQLHHLQHKVKAAATPAEPENVPKASKVSGKDSSSASGSKSKDKSSSGTRKKEPEVKSTKVYKDPFIEAEDAEIARLEKLMGITKGKSSKKAVSEKLNKEFELFEGISGGFGDFLNDLDDLTDMIENEKEDDGKSSKSSKKSSKRKRIFADNSDNEDEDVEEVRVGVKPGGHIIDDSEQEQSDIEDGTGQGDYDESDGDGDFSGEEGDDGEGGDDYSEVLREESDVDDEVVFSENSDSDDGVNEDEEDDDGDDDDDDDDDSNDDGGGMEYESDSQDESQQEQQQHQQQKKSQSQPQSLKQQSRGKQQDDDQDQNQSGSADSDGDSRQQDSDEEEGSSGNDEDGSGNSDQSNGPEGSEGSESENDSENEDEDDEEKESKNNLLFTYKPVAGEDIYGRKTATTGEADANAPKKYIPPGKRKEVLSKIDETSESVRIVRKELNGLMNKLSDSSKDSIVRSIKQVFMKNSTSICSLVLKDCILAACSNPSLLMTSLIPIYAAVVAALHFSIGVDVGAFIIEALSVSLHTSISQSASAAKTKDQSGKPLISSKLPNNALLLLCYLYNLRVVHHTLIVDIMNALADITVPTVQVNGKVKQSTQAQQAADVVSLIGSEYLELRVELLEVLINHCGTSIRSDDPVSLKNVINSLSKTLKHINGSQLTDNIVTNGGSTSAAGASGGVPENSRLKFMFEALTDLKNNKSRRIQTVNADIVKGLRKWLGTIKTTLGAKSGDLCLRVTLKDLLDAEQRGRWWKAGASWTGKDTSNPDGDNIATSSNTSTATRAVSAVVNKEEEMLLKLATKLRMNTSIRRSIFIVLMSSRDVLDAFERLTKLELKGKQDREIVLVIIECCGQEKTYNPFYFELAKMLCGQNRQYKTTFQFAIWDFSKTVQAVDDDEDTKKQQNVSTRRVVNIARLLAQLVCSFNLPLTVIKTIEMTELNNKLVLFLSTFFLALFKENIPDEDFTSVVDRVATTKDFATVRDNILFFLRRYLEQIPSGLDPAESKKILRRKKATIKTMEAMTVLDISRGMMEGDADEDD